MLHFRQDWVELFCLAHSLDISIWSNQLGPALFASWSGLIPGQDLWAIHVTLVILWVNCQGLRHCILGQSSLFGIKCSHTHLLSQNISFVWYKRFHIHKTIAKTSLSVLFSLKSQFLRLPSLKLLLAGQQIIWTAQNLLSRAGEWTRAKIDFWGF